MLKMMMTTTLNLLRRVTPAAICGATLLLVAGCPTAPESGREQSGSATALTANVGNYPPPPPEVLSLDPRPSVAIPPFSTESNRSNVRLSNGLNQLMADQLSTMMVKAGRFDVIERAQLDKIVQEQALGDSGLADAETMAEAGNVQGVDYLLVGKITNFSAEQVDRGRSMNIPVVGRTRTGGTDINVEVGVDLRLIDASTGRVLAAESTDFKQTDSTSSFGMDRFFSSSNDSTSLEISDDNKGKILRLALDDAVRKMMDQIDNELKRKAATS